MTLEMDTDTRPPTLPDRLLSALACPACHAPLTAEGGGLACAACATTFAFEGRTPVLFVPKTRDTVERDIRDWGEQIILPNVRFRWIRRLMSPQVHRWGPERRRIAERLRALPPEALVVDVGCGAESAWPGLVRLDIAPGPQVDIAADAHDLPFRDGSVDVLLLVRVLEHVRDPQRVVAEAARVLRPGGEVLAVVPFLEPYHRNPTDHSRYCRDGVERLFGAFETVELSVATGPAVTLVWFLKELVAVAFPFSDRPRLYAAVREVAGWLLSPLAWLDPLLRGKAFAHKVAGSFWYVGRRR